ncbi:dihydroneopterin aldolase/2-amino-4-hydroxy-6-hydroxymethyldihydropteridine diphosphokinase [Isoptericola jiangsuensis]|uniref:Bifunctional folate synthesis protein n=1 Tax=Isoptericola jiangsuensis TaxID=548579 RepID=A0A2A9F1I6_9MICO|nr:2-amino-4-hydroxy-6-hydroxymethyldihydropteridine diphosphokinase [Isoptericola jiangsuensis]PFG44402.1 dihydroneopterin aldolase/2-amino-4-hydroxy-6-hydroxymethyldihydropteridine diphosphokinase [Isoptericola jiangsuensis]
MTYAETVVGPDGHPLDQIRLTGVTAVGHHGVLPAERVEGQTFRADVVLHLDTSAAAVSDDLDATVSYAEVAEDVHAILAGDPVDLVETVAERIAAAVLARPAVHAVDVRVHKPQAPISVPFEDVEIVVRRDRQRLPAVPAPVLRDVEQPAPVEVAPSPALALVPDLADDEGEASPVDAAELAVPAPPEPEQPEPEPVVDPLDAAPATAVDAVIALGANLGDPQGTLRAAVTDIDRVPGVQVMEVSPLARTAAVGPEQPDYLNAVLIVRTSLSPRDLLSVCQEVELLHGRVREERWGPRTLDVDVVQYGSLTATSHDLDLPHPRAHERAFVLVPWAELDPEAVLGGLGGGPVAQLAATAPDRGGIRWLALDWLTEPALTGAVPVQPEPADEPAEDAPAAAPSEEPQHGAHATDQSHGTEQSHGEPTPPWGAPQPPAWEPEQQPGPDPEQPQAWAPEQVQAPVRHEQPQQPAVWTPEQQPEQPQAWVPEQRPEEPQAWVPEQQPQPPVWTPEQVPPEPRHPQVATPQEWSPEQPQAWQPEQPTADVQPAPEPAPLWSPQQVPAEPQAPAAPVWTPEPAAEQPVTWTPEQPSRPAWEQPPTQEWAPERPQTWSPAPEQPQAWEPPAPAGVVESTPWGPAGGTPDAASATPPALSVPAAPSFAAQPAGRAAEQHRSEARQSEQYQQEQYRQEQFRPEDHHPGHPAPEQYRPERFQTEPAAASQPYRPEAYGPPATIPVFAERQEPPAYLPDAQGPAQPLPVASVQVPPSVPPQGAGGFGADPAGRA